MLPLLKLLYYIFYKLSRRASQQVHSAAGSCRGLRPRAAARRALLRRREAAGRREFRRSHDRDDAADVRAARGGGHSPL